MSGDEYMRLVAARNATDGYRIYWLINSVIVSHGIFDGNHKELHARLTEYAEPKVAARLWKQDGPSEAQAELWELIRLIHNYIASVRMLVDHTRIIANKLLLGELLSPYQQRVDEFKNDPASKFLHRLRDFVLHITNPPIRARIKLAEMTSDIYLDNALLLEWEDWSSGNRDFINANPDGIVLLTLVDGYERKVRTFYEWLIDYFHDARRSEMDAFWAKQDEWVAFCHNNGIPITEL